MSKNFEIVLYYKKRVIIDGKPSLSTMVETKKKLESFDEDDEDNVNQLLDGYNKDKREIGRDEIVDAWVLIEENSSFIDNVVKIESDENFIEWEPSSDTIIKSKMSELF